MIVKENTKKELKGSKKSEDKIKELFSVGAHYAYSRSKRHPSAEPFIFGVKNRVEIFDLEKVEQKIKEAEDFAEKLGEGEKKILFVGSKNEARKCIDDYALSISQPSVSGRWVGGTLTNFSEIRKRVQRLNDLEEEKKKGELAKYTKKEQLLFSREVENLEKKFGGIKDMVEVPSAIFIVDIRREKTALREGKLLGLPVITFSNSNCDLSEADLSIPGNDCVRKSIDYILNRFTAAYKRGLKKAPLSEEVKRSEK